MGHHDRIADLDASAIEPIRGRSGDIAGRP
jgi:hypothetical protein